MSYTIDFSNSGNVPPQKSPIMVGAGTMNNTATSLTLTGKGYANYGEVQQENFVRMLENFASPTPPLYPTSGQLWFDTTANKMKVYSTSNNWVSATSVEAGAEGTEPDTPLVGQLWYNTTDKQVYVYTGTNWKVVSNSAEPIASGLPAGPASDGEMYFNTTTKILYIWTGDDWRPAGGGAFVSATPPTPAYIGQLWYKSSEQMVYVCYGISPTEVWKLSSNGAHVSAGNDEPNVPTIGELWFDTTAQILKVRTSTNTWAVAGGGSMAGTVPPTPPYAGELWYNTNDNRVYVYTDEGVWNSITSVSTDGIFPPEMVLREGQLTWNAFEEQLKVRIGSNWKTAALSASVTDVWDAPGKPSTFSGALWLDLSTNTFKVRIGDSFTGHWESIPSIGTVQTMINNTIANAVIDGGEFFGPQ